MKRRYRASMPIKEDGRTRYFEYLIRPGAQLYVLGECVKGNSGSLEVVGSPQQLLIVTKRPFKVLLDDHAKTIWIMLILIVVFVVLLCLIN